MKKYEREEILEKLAGKILLQLTDAIEAGDLKEAKKISTLYNKIDRGW